MTIGHIEKEKWWKAQASARVPETIIISCPTCNSMLTLDAEMLEALRQGQVLTCAFCGEQRLISSERLQEMGL